VTLRVVLASASPARLARLRAAGLDPEVVVSGVAEDDVLGDPAEVALELARRKATAVAGLPEAAGALVIGCDSLLDLEGVAVGKPQDAAEAVQRWRSMRGRSAELVTGHWLVDTRTGRSTGSTARTVVRFGTPTDDEIDAYVATGEPLVVAGAFTIDGLGAWFVDGVDGDPSNVIGISLPLLRTLLADLDIPLVEAWGPLATGAGRARRRS
jgi:septum formation protein